MINIINGWTLSEIILSIDILVLGSLEAIQSLFKILQLWPLVAKVHRRLLNPIKDILRAWILLRTKLVYSTEMLHLAMTIDNIQALNKVVTYDRH